jgi:hypothetical protein
LRTRELERELEEIHSRKFFLGMSLRDAFLQTFAPLSHHLRLIEVFALEDFAHREQKFLISINE